MRSISSLFDLLKPRAPAARRAVFTLALTVAGASTASFAQTDDDPYGLPGASAPGTPSVPVEEAPPAPAAVPDAAAPGVAADTAAAPVTPAAPVAAPRARVTRETTINPLDQQKGAYRNPKKALFMSLLVPGLGQAYVGQSAFTYARAALYFGTEITLGVLWYQYTVVKYDRVTERYRRFADEHWSQQGYEEAAFQAGGVVTPVEFRAINPYRTSYCESVVDRESASGAVLFNGCVSLLDSAESQGYANFRSQYPDQPTPEATGAFRSGFADPVEFYALIGSYQEFVAGWDDAFNVSYSADSISGASANRDIYNRMRGQAQDYSRMQAWFIGGIVINHIASAVDAALTARHNNRVLYEGEARWYDRMKVDGGLAFDAGRPRTHMSARLSF